MNDKVDPEALDDIRAMVAERVDQAASEYGKADPGAGGVEITDAFIQSCYYMNELGDGLLFAYEHSGRYLFNVTSNEWMARTEHHWDVDTLGNARGAVDSVAQHFIQMATKTTQKIAKAVEDGEPTKTIKKLQDFQVGLFKRASRLRSDKGRTGCLSFAKANAVLSLAVDAHEFDTEPMDLGVGNGIVDLYTGEFRPSKAADRIHHYTPVQWDGIDAECPTWIQCLKDIFMDDDKLIDFMQVLLGYGLTGLSTEHVLPVLWGKGRNGKDTIIETVSHVMGSLAGAIVSETLLDQGRFKSASGPSEDIVTLKGLRLGFAAESDENRRFSASKVKWLSGGNTLKGRLPFDKRSIEFTPTHLLVLVTNHKPQAPAYDYAFWERVMLVPFDRTFVEHEPENENQKRMDKGLKAELLKESPGILAWLVKGCIEWQKLGGVKPPAKIREATAEYRRGEDILADFIEEVCYEDPNAWTEAAVLYDAFKVWFSLNVSKKNILSQKRFGAMAKEKFQRRKVGTVRYIGVGILEENLRLDDAVV